MARYNLSVPREGKDGKTFWDKVGVMFERDKGGFSIRLSLFPNLNIIAFPAEDDRQGGGGGGGRGDWSRQPDEDDAPPF